MRKFFLALSFLPFGVSQAYAQDITQANVSAFCNAPVRVVSGEGRQPNGEWADKAVMALKPGHYEARSGAQLAVFDKGLFALKPPPTISTTFGTEADDLIQNGQLGGCSLGQLSEMLIKNNMPVADFTPAQEKKP